MTQPKLTLATIEHRLANKWAELLDVKASDVTAGNDFFSLGGNSMLLLSLHLFACREFAISLSLPELVEHAEFGSMVQLICNKVQNKE